MCNINNICDIPPYISVSMKSQIVGYLIILWYNMILVPNGFNITMYNLFAVLTGPGSVKAQQTIIIHTSLTSWSCFIMTRCHGSIPTYDNVYRDTDQFDFVNDIAIMMLGKVLLYLLSELCLCKLGCESYHTRLLSCAQYSSCIVWFRSFHHRSGDFYCKYLFMVCHVEILQ